MKTDQEFLAEELARERHEQKKESILAAARETVDRLRDHKPAVAPEPEEEDPIAKWRREMEPYDQMQRARERAKEQRLAEAAAPPPEPDLVHIETMLRGAIEREREFVFECVGNAIGLEIEKQHKLDRQEFEKQAKANRAELAQLWKTVTELTKAITALNRKSERDEIEKRHHANIARIWKSVEELAQAVQGLARADRAERAARGEAVADPNKLT